MESILVVNAGSSSLKFQLFGIEPARQLKRMLKGQVDGIGVRPRLRAAMIDSSTAVDRVFPPDEIPDLPAAIHVTGAWLRETQQVDLVAIGHCVVHGGPEYSQPVLVSEEVIDRLARYTTLAPRLAKENNRHRQSEAELARQDIGRQPQYVRAKSRRTPSGRSHSTRSSISSPACPPPPRHRRCWASIAIIGGSRSCIETRTSSSARTATRIVATTLLETFSPSPEIRGTLTNPRHRALSGRQKPRNPAVLRLLLNYPAAG